MSKLTGGNLIKSYDFSDLTLQPQISNIPTALACNPTMSYAVLVWLLNVHCYLRVFKKINSTHEIHVYLQARD